jgi:hypothetical protein
VAQAPAVLPPFKGSALRGAFGHALKRAVCVMPGRSECGGCPLVGACVYTRLFETFLDAGPPPPFLAGVVTAPRPFVFECADGQSELAAGATLEFDLVLVGRAVELQAFAVLAVEDMALQGLGAGRHEFRLERVVVVDALGRTRDAGYRPDGPWQLAPPAPVPPSTNGLPPDRLAIELVTPLRIESGGQLRDRLAPRELVLKMLQRVLLLTHFFGDRERIDWAFRPLLDHASGLEVEAARLRWQPLTRYSNRQGRKIAQGGLVGELILTGDLAPLHALFRAAEVFHIGKGATFGLGQVALGAE